MYGIQYSMYTFFTWNLFGIKLLRETLINLPQRGIYLLGVAAGATLYKDGGQWGYGTD